LRDVYRSFKQGNYQEQYDSKYDFYSNYTVAADGKPHYYSSWEQNTNRSTLIAILGGTLPLAVMVFIVALF